jgi:hypothetical protein
MAVGETDQNGLSPRASARSTSPTTASAIAEALQRAVSSSQPRRRRSASASSSVTPAPKLLTTGCLASAPMINARVAGGPFRMSATVKAPLAILSSTQDRPAAWNARRHDGRQNFCGQPPLCRAWNGRPHQEQRGTSLTAGSAVPPRSPGGRVKCDGELRDAGDHVHSTSTSPMRSASHATGSIRVASYRSFPAGPLAPSRR